MTAAALEPNLGPVHPDSDARNGADGVNSSMLTARALVHECVEDHPEFDANEVADCLLAQGLPAEAHSYVLREGLIGIAGHIHRDARRLRRAPTTDLADREAEPNFSARWENARQCVDVFQQRWPHPSGRTRMLGDFTRSDAEWAVDWFHRLASSATDSAAKFKKLVEVLPKNGKPTHSLPRERVEAIFNA